MKIKSRYINENSNRRTKPGEFIYYKGTLLKVVEAKRNYCGCYFHNNFIGSCTLSSPESNWISFYCTYISEGKIKHLHFEEV